MYSGYEGDKIMFQSNVKKFRKAKHLSQEDFAMKLNVVRQTVSKWECGTTMPDILLLPVLAEIFETSIDALFGIEENINATALHAEKPEAAEKPKKTAKKLLFLVNKS